MKTELTRKEKDYIINELSSSINSVYLYETYKNKNRYLFFNEILKAPEDCFDMKEKEVNMIKSVLKKLRK